MTAVGSTQVSDYSRRRHTAQYKIQAPCVFDKIIRLSNAKQGPMQSTTVDDESTHRDARIRMQTVASAAERPCQQHAIQCDDVIHSCCTRDYNRCRSYNGTGSRDHEYGRILVPKHSHTKTVDGTRQSTASKHRMYSIRPSICRKQNTDRCRSPPSMM